LGSGVLEANMTSVLVYGFYNNHSNKGDELFKKAFKIIFPELSFTFTDRITVAQLLVADAVFFGGGSFLYAPPSVEGAASVLLRKKPIFYIGVGIETAICAEHRDLIKKALLVAPRTAQNHMVLLQELSENIHPIPDLLYSLPPQKKKITKPNSILILPNISTVPTHEAPHWKHISWEHFKFEFAQFIDVLIDMHYQPAFFAMQQHSNENDTWVAHEIMNSMRHRSSDMILSQKDINFTEFECIITQRMHGIVLAELNNIPYMCIHHSDKLKKEQYNIGEFMSFFHCSKDSLFDTFYEMQKKNATKTRIELNTFETLKEKIYACLDIQCQNTPESKIT
jgi:hypothetical protein